ncbi:MAG: methionine biosynthesis protein MetW [Burkholderiales bacterium]
MARPLWRMGHEVVVPGDVVALELHDAEVGDRGAKVREMVRVCRGAIVSFPNFGHWNGWCSTRVSPFRSYPTSSTGYDMCNARNSALA